MPFSHYLEWNIFCVADQYFSVSEMRSEHSFPTNFFCNPSAFLPDNRHIFELSLDELIENSSPSNIFDANYFDTAFGSLLGYVILEPIFIEQERKCIFGLLLRYLTQKSVYDNP